MVAKECVQYWGIIQKFKVRPDQNKLRIAPLLWLSRSRATRKKTARNKWPREILVRAAVHASCGHVFLAVFFRVMRDRSRERGTTRIL